MKIIHFIDSLRFGGKERQVVELIKGLSNYGFIEQVLICMDYEDFYKPVIDRTNIPIKYFIRKSRWDPRIFSSIYALSKEFKPDIIHTNSMMSSFYSLPATKLLNISLVNGCIRNAFPEGGWRWKLEKILLQLSDYRIANSYAGLASRHFDTSHINYVIYNGFDFSRIDCLDNKHNPHENLPNSAGKKIVGMVAEFSANKDYSTFIDAAKTVLEKRNDVTFWLIGDGDNFDKIKAMAESYKDIHFLGKKQHIEFIVNLFSIGVLSTYTEGISNSLMEYMALRKPVIATLGSGNNELVTDGVDGFLIPGKHPDIMADKINYLLDNKALRLKMGDEGRKKIENNFSFESMINNTLQVFQFAIKSKDKR